MLDVPCAVFLYYKNAKLQKIYDMKLLQKSNFWLLYIVCGYKYMCPQNDTFLHNATLCISQPFDYTT